ncbi:hypothetical protein ACXHXM_36385|uniref:hypothetical protein n=1 Tax=Rhizobium altiplani TaxID=1864509 RepID=UPI00068576F5|nr:hypothetical protein [Rhizobium altiplani]
MRPETVEKRLASIIDLSRQGKRINGLFRLLSAQSLWMKAYEQIAPNKGALTTGVDPQSTSDGFSLERMEAIITRVIDGSYCFSPAGGNTYLNPTHWAFPLRTTSLCRQR